MSMPEWYTLIWEQNPVMYDSLISDPAFSNASKIFRSSQFKMSKGLGLGSKGMGKVRGREDVGDGGGLGKVGGTGKSLGVVEEKKKVGAGGGNGRPASPGEGKRWGMEVGWGRFRGWVEEGFRVWWLSKRRRLVRVEERGGLHPRLF
ncbi:hypothetical protein ACFX2J_017984 [Malus domestica]